MTVKESAWDALREATWKSKDAFKWLILVKILITKRKHALGAMQGMCSSVENARSQKLMKANKFRTALPTLLKGCVWNVSTDTTWRRTAVTKWTFSAKNTIKQMALAPTATQASNSKMGSVSYDEEAMINLYPNLSPKLTIKFDSLECLEIECL